MSDSAKERPGSGQQSRAERRRFERLEARFRHLGYFIFFGVSALLFFPILWGAIEGIRNDRVWDPFTDEPVHARERLVDCESETGELIFLGGQYDGLDGAWEMRYRRWVTRCREENPEYYRLLKSTRERLRGVQERPDLEAPSFEEE